MHDETVSDAINFMWLNYEEDITLDRLADRASYSKFHFLRQFKAATGVTPCRYLTEIRVARARELLADDHSMSITELALAVGYGSMGAFSTRFRHAVGLTPSEYRSLRRSASIDEAEDGITEPQIRPLPWISEPGTIPRRIT